MTKRWLTMDIEGKDLSAETLDNLSFLLYDIGAVGVEMSYAHDYLNNHANLFGEIHDPLTQEVLDHPTVITAYFEDQVSVEQVKQAIKNFGIHDNVTIQERLVVEENWQQHWMKYYQPQHISRYVTVKPIWHDYQASPLEQVIELDPGLAFGTGNHLTTQLSAQALEIVLRGGEDVIDVGTGSGILSLIAKSLGAKEVWGYDLDPQAIDAAQANLKLQTHPAFDTEGQEKVHFAVNDLLKHHQAPADIIVANILPHILVNMFADATTLLKDQGYLILGGILRTKASEIMSEMEAYPFELRQEIYAGEWVGFIYQKEDNIACKDIS